MSHGTPILGRSIDEFRQSTWTETSGIEHSRRRGSSVKPRLCCSSDLCNTNNLLVPRKFELLCSRVDRWRRRIYDKKKEKPESCTGKMLYASQEETGYLTKIVVRFFFSFELFNII